MTIERIATGRPTLLAYRVRGRIDRDAIEAVSAELLEAFDREGEIDLLVVLADWDGTDADAWLSRQRMAAQARSVRHVRRYAVVGAPRWAEAMIGVFGAILPVDARTFDPEDEAVARAWLDEGKRPVAG